MKPGILLVLLCLSIILNACGSAPPVVRCEGSSELSESDDLVAEIKLTVGPTNNKCSYTFSYSDEVYRTALMSPNQSSKVDAPTKYSYPSLSFLGVVPEINRFIFLGEYMKGKPPYDERMQLGMKDGYFKVGPASCTRSAKADAVSYELRQEIFDQDFTTVFVNPKEKYEIECTSNTPLFLSSAPWTWASKDNKTLIIK